MRKAVIAVCLLAASCRVFPPEGEKWQDEVRSKVISLDTGGDFASETAWLKRNHPERCTYTYSG